MTQMTQMTQELRLVGSVTIMSAGTERSVEIFDSPDYASLAYVVRMAFNGGQIVEEDDNKARVVHPDGQTVLVVVDPKDYQLENGDKIYVAKIHDNG